MNETMSMDNGSSSRTDAPLGFTVTDVLTHLKSRARALHKQVAKRGPIAIARLRAVPGDASLTDEEIVGQTKRRHCLSVIALELGFRGWAQLAHVLEGGGEGADFGSILCPMRMMSHQNIWLSDYAEAKRIRNDHGGFLLAYRKQFFIADGDYLLDLGLDPEAEGWEAMGRDWVTPDDLNARARFYARLFAERLTG